MGMNKLISSQQIIRIASRKSDLARIQAYSVGAALESISPMIQIEYQFRESLGDKNLNDPLWKIPQKGVFTQDFHQDLVSDQTDIVVHSWKELAVEENPETFVACTFEREDVRDVLLVKKSHFDQIQKRQQLRIYTSSPRRMFHFTEFARNYLPFQIQNCTYESVRGNIQTRLRKMLEAKDIDGILMAKAGLDRMLSAVKPEFSEAQDFFQLAFKDLEFVILPISTNPQAPAQGALALEIKRNRSDLIELLHSLNHQRSFQNVVRERDILKSYGGGCHSKIGVSCLSGDDFQLTLVHGEIDKKEIRRSEFSSTRALPFKHHYRPEQIFAPQSSEFFELETLNIDPVISQITSLNQNTNLTLAMEIAKEAYLTDQLYSQFPKSCLIWSSGLETWKKLAQRNIWVHGSQESLGSFIRRPKDLWGQNLQWCKLTHDLATSYPGYQSATSDHIQPISICKLTQKKNLPDLSSYDAFFWRSGSLFLKAIQEQPQIIDKNHFCGFGETYQIISKHLETMKKTNLVYQFPSEKIWRHYVTKI